MFITWDEQRFLRSKYTNDKEILINWVLLKLRPSVYQKIPLREEKRQTQNEVKHLPYILSDRRLTFKIYNQFP